MAIGLPFYLRVPVLPLLACGSGILWLGWRFIVQPLLERYTITRAALLGRSQTATQLWIENSISALECYHDLSAESPRFDGGMVRAAWSFIPPLPPLPKISRRSIDTASGIRRPVVWPAVRCWRFWVSALSSLHRGRHGPGNFCSLGTALGRRPQRIAQKVGGARIGVDAARSPRAYLRGSDTVTIHRPSAWLPSRERHGGIHPQSRASSNGPPPPCRVDERGKVRRLSTKGGDRQFPDTYSRLGPDGERPQERDASPSVRASPI